MPNQSEVAIEAAARALAAWRASRGDVGGLAPGRAQAQAEAVLATAREDVRALLSPPPA